MKKKLKVKTCYEHLGGALGNRLFKRLIELNWFELDPDDASYYIITAEGEKKLQNLGVDIYTK